MGDICFEPGLNQAKNVTELYIVHTIVGIIPFQIMKRVPLGTLIKNG